MKFKFIFLFFLFVIIFSSFSATVFGAYGYEEKQIYKDTGADELIYSLPDETRQYLEKAGISTDSVDKLSLEGVLQSVLDVFSEKSERPLKSGIKVLAILIISAMICGLKEGLGDESLKRAVTAVTGAAVSLAVAIPLSSVIDGIQKALTSAERFTVAFTPVYGAIMSVSGSPVSAASFSGVTAVVCSVVSIIICLVILPLSRVLMGFSVISACSQNRGMYEAAGLFQKYIKWILCICSVIFMGVLAVKGAVAASSDTVASRTARFVVSNFIPVVGSTLSDATNVVYSSLKLIKGTVGAFGIITFGYIFLPVIIELLAWMGVVEFCSFGAKLMGLKHTEGMFSSVSAVMGILMSSSVFSMFALVISTASAVIGGGGGG